MSTATLEVTTLEAPGLTAAALAPVLLEDPAIELQLSRWRTEGGATLPDD